MPAAKSNASGFHGFLTYRGLRLFALMLMTLSQSCNLMLLSYKLGVVLGLDLYSDFALSLIDIGRILGQASFPMLLIASIGIVLSGGESIKKMLISYFAIALVTYLATVLLAS